MCQYLDKFVFLLFCFFMKEVKSSEILLVSNCVSHSHSIWYNKLATLLVDSGHQVVLLDTDPLKSKAGNITHFLIEGAHDFSGMDMTPEFMEDNAESSTLSSIFNIDFYYTFTTETCRKYLRSQGVQNLLDSYRGKNFDLIILDYFCDSFLGLVPYFGNPPFIIATAFADPESTLAMVGHFDNPSFVPARMFSSFSPEMNFIQRAINTYYYLHHLYRYRTQYIPYEEESAKQVFGPLTPSIDEIRLNVSIVLVNTHFSISGAKPTPPAVIPISGFHIESSKPLLEDIKQFLDGAESGAILFSFGSNIPSELISPKKVKMYVEVFSSIPQRVIWKFNESYIEKIPMNVMVKNWVPQQDILRHKNTVAFISHGGLLGTQEAMYFGVPLIGIPIMVDQISNVEEIASKGLGTSLSFKYITAETLKAAIIKVTTNKSYTERMESLSKILTDNPMNPRDTVKYWVEYVIRHKDRLNYIHSQSANLEIYQIFLLDLLAAALLLVTFFSLSVALMIKFILKRTIFKSNKNEKLKEN